MTDVDVVEGRLVSGRYRIERLLGRGGMGTVWAAHDELLHRDVALKEVHPPPGVTSEQWAELRLRSMREARAAARLAHPSVVTVYDVIEEDDGRPWIVMELLGHATLADVVADDGPLSPAAAARLGLDLVDALEAAHRVGVLHRDVKPANVLLAADGGAVLTDFGIATLEGDPALTAQGVLLGSPGYMSPELARGERPTPASDLWSLGATLYAAVEGQAPFRREGQLATLCAVLTEEPPQPVHAGPLRPVLAGLLERDPALRLSAELARQGLRNAAAVLTRGEAVDTDGAHRAVLGRGTVRPRMLDRLDASSIATVPAEPPSQPVPRLQPVLPLQPTGARGRPVVRRQAVAAGLGLAAVSLVASLTLALRPGSGQDGASGGGTGGGAAAPVSPAVAGDTGVGRAAGQAPPATAVTVMHVSTGSAPAASHGRRPPAPPQPRRGTAGPPTDHPNPVSALPEHGHGQHRGGHGPA